jgi:Peptidase family M23
MMRRSIATIIRSAVVFATLTAALATAPAAFASSSTPVTNEISYWLGHITESWHQSYNGYLEYGTDFGMAVDTPIYAVESGPVLGAGYYGGGGVISIEAATTISEYYQHLDCVYVSKGQSVTAGQLIGTSGGNTYGSSQCGHLASSNFSGGPHLEWGINAPYGGMWAPLGANQNPVPYLQNLLARSSSSAYETAFQANTSDLWTVGSDSHGAWNLGLMKGTSPSIVNLAGGGYEVAFQANTSSLWTVGRAGNRDWGLGMMAGTSPSITALAGGGYEVAFQANTSDLWTVGNAGNRDWGLGMMAGTSPSIAGVGGSFEVAFQANTSSLWTVGEDNHRAWNLGMRSGTSPSIAAAGGSYEVAFQANTSSLWTVGEDNHGAWNLGTMSGTSPSIS